jgi:glucose/mannose-6-phosphate isomerase
MESMEKLIAQFPKHISDALATANGIDYKSLKNSSFSNVVICGMGGSGIGGGLVSRWFSDTCSVPITLVQDYQVPLFVNEKSLVIGSSYSGNTEETICAIEDAIRKQATVIGISSGGELIKICKDHNFEFAKVPGGNPPRSMLAFSVIHLVHVLAQAKLIESDSLQKIARCRHLLNSELIQIKSTAKLLADFSFKKQVNIYSPVQHEGASIRLRQQFNENAKQLCMHHIIPEMNHNELVGWEGGNDDFAVVFIKGQQMNKRVRLRFELSKEIIGRKTKHIFELEAKGTSLIEESFYLIHIIDWASIYLAELNNVNPIEIKAIEYLKSSLEKINE